MKLLNQLLLAILGMVFLTGCKESTSILSLAGEWEFAIDSMDIGISKHWYTQSFPDKIKLPGTMDDAGYGIPQSVITLNKQTSNIASHSQTQLCRTGLVHT